MTSPDRLFEWVLRELGYLIDRGARPAVKTLGENLGGHSDPPAVSARLGVA